MVDFLSGLPNLNRLQTKKKRAMKRQHLQRYGKNLILLFAVSATPFRLEPSRANENSKPVADTDLTAKPSEQPPPFIKDDLLPGCKNPLILGFAGDVFVSQRSFRLGEKLASGVRSIINLSDVFVANFEGVVGTNLERAYPDAPFALRMPAEVPEYLKTQGITAVTLGNNHIMDYGIKGLQDTLQALRHSKLLHAGAGLNEDEARAPLAINAKGRVLHVLSFNATLPKESWASENKPGTAYPSREALKSAIEKSRSAADFVAVAFHWGQESSIELRPYQKQMAARALKAGADFVYGHHAHIAQGIKKSGEKTIAYGLGNFLFDSYSENSVMSLVALVPFCLNTGSSMRHVRPVFVPLLTNNYENHFVTRPLQRHEFLGIAASYTKSEAFDPDSLIWFPNGQPPEPFSSLSQRPGSFPVPDLQKKDNSTSLAREEEPMKEKTHEQAQPDTTDE